MVTVSEKKKVLEDCHSHGKQHLDTVMDKTLAKVSERYYWPRMEVDVEELCQSCEQCQATNRLNYTAIIIMFHAVSFFLASNFGLLYTALLMNAVPS